MTAIFTSEDAFAAVRLGAAWLDSKCPDWFEEIDLEKLDLEYADTCILGQAAPCLISGSASYMFRYHRVTEFYGMSPAWIIDHGFNAPNAATKPATAEFEMLGIAWRELIRERLAVVA